jgi:hypothetical protein
MTIEITPKVFIRSWGDVIDAYHHPSNQLIINLSNGQTIAIRDEAEIALATETFRNRAKTICNFLDRKEALDNFFDRAKSPKTAELPSDIAFWMPTAQNFTLGKRISPR